LDARGAGSVPKRLPDRAFRQRRIGFGSPAEDLGALLAGSRAPRSSPGRGVTLGFCGRSAGGDATMR